MYKRATDEGDRAGSFVRDVKTSVFAVAVVFVVAAAAAAA